MARNPEYDVTLDGVGYILTRDGLGVSRAQANPYAMKSSSGERTYADLDEWAVFQVSSCHRGMGQERYGDPEQFWYSYSVDTRFKDKVILGPQMQAVDADGISDSGRMHFAQFDDALYCGVDDNVYELVDGDWTSRDEVADEDVDGMVVYNEYLYVCRGANPIRKSADGTAWTDVGDTPEAFDLYVHGGFLYRSTGKTLYYSSDPEAASPTWSTGIAIGSTDYNIHSMCTYQNSLIVFKGDGAWRIPGNPGDLDKAYRVPELDWRFMIHDDNGVYSCVWSDGFLYVTVGAGGLLRWTGRTVTPMGPDTLLAGTIGRGTIRGLVPTPSFLYLFLRNTGGGDGFGATPILAWNGSGWHAVSYNVSKTGEALHYFDEHLYCGWYNPSTTNYEVYKAYLPQQSLDPTQDSAYQYNTGSYTQILFPKFTANLHHTYKEFRSITLWLDNEGGTISGTQSVILTYKVDGGDFMSAGTFTVADGGQETFEIDFTVPSFADKQVASVDSDRDTVTLVTGDMVSDLSNDDWLYFAGTNEYRYVDSTSAGPPATITLQCPLDSEPAANTYIRPGIPVGRWIIIQLTLSTTAVSRTPVVRALALKYLVNIGDYDIWQLNVQVSDPLTLRNNTAKRQPIADQLSRLDEIRKKGRVTFIDEVGDTHTVKVTNYSLQPTRQRVDSGMEPETGYACKLTLLEV